MAKGARGAKLAEVPATAQLPRPRAAARENATGLVVGSALTGALALSAQVLSVPVTL